MPRIDIQASLHYATAAPDLAMVVVTQDEDGDGVAHLPDNAFEVLLLAKDTVNGISGFGLDGGGTDPRQEDSQVLIGNRQCGCGDRHGLMMPCALAICHATSLTRY
jgi:hypothetical protein